MKTIDKQLSKIRKRAEKTPEDIQWLIEKIESMRDALSQIQKMAEHQIKSYDESNYIYQIETLARTTLDSLAEV